MNEEFLDSCLLSLQVVEMDVLRESSDAQKTFLALIDPYICLIWRCSKTVLLNNNLCTYQSNNQPLLLQGPSHIPGCSIFASERCQDEPFS